MSLAFRFLPLSPSAEASAGRRWPVLLLLGGASGLVYLIGLLLPYNLFALRLRALQDVARLTRGQPLAQAGYVLTFAALSGLYYLAWRTCRGRASRAMWIALLLSLAIVNLAMLWLYPIDAADIFDNIARGRIIAEYGGNPFYETPSDYPGDPFRYKVAWPNSTSAYGPLWELLAAGTSRLAGDGWLANVLAFKLLGLVFYAGCIALIVAILRRLAPERALQGVCLFAWNPLVIYETAGNGHNDILLAFWVLLGIYALTSRRFVAGALAFTAGMLVKFVPALLLPIAVVGGLRVTSGWRARLRFLGGSGLACAALVVLAYAPFWRGGDPLSLERRASLFTTSLPAFAQAQLQPSLGAAASQRIVAGAALLLTGLLVAWQTWQAWRETDALAPVRASAHVLLFYLLITCLWFQPWYAIWLLGLAAILPEGATARTVVLLSYTALWKTILFDFLLFRTRPLPPKAVREMILGPATLGLVWLYSGFALTRAAMKKRAGRLDRSAVEFPETSEVFPGLARQGG